MHDSIQGLCRFLVGWKCWRAAIGWCGDRPLASHLACVTVTSFTALAFHLPARGRRVPGRPHCSGDAPRGPAVGTVEMKCAMDLIGVSQPRPVGGVFYPPCIPITLRVLPWRRGASPTPGGGGGGQPDRVALRRPWYLSVPWGPCPSSPLLEVSRASPWLPFGSTHPASLQVEQASGSAVDRR
jgi:hypothetical protein